MASLLVKAYFKFSNQPRLPCGIGSSQPKLINPRGEKLMDGPFWSGAKKTAKNAHFSPSSHHGGPCSPLFPAKVACNALVLIIRIKINRSPPSVKYCRADFAPDAVSDPAGHGGARRRKFLARDSRNINIKHI